jgi:cytoskeletal protein CcmA (bactofilin family)
MALWKDTNSPSVGGPASADATVTRDSPARDTLGSGNSSSPGAPTATITAAARPKPVETRTEMKESVISADLAVEGKIIGAGHVRIAGKFKGDVQVEGNLTIDAGAKLDGQVKAAAVIVSGELQGNIESAKRVDLLAGGVINGDVKAGSLTVASGSRMRGQVEFGWDDDGVKSTKSAAHG